MSLQELLNAFLALGGVAAFIAAGLNILKVVGVVPDGQTGTYSLIANAVMFGLYIAAHIAGFDVSKFDSVLAGIATLITALLPFLAQLLVSKGVHVGLKALKVPVLGKSFSK